MVGFRIDMVLAATSTVGALAIESWNQLSRTEGIMVEVAAETMVVYSSREGSTGFKRVTLALPMK